MNNISIFITLHLIGLPFLKLISIYRTLLQLPASAIHWKYPRL